MPMNLLLDIRGHNQLTNRIKQAQRTFQSQLHIHPKNIHMSLFSTPNLSITFLTASLTHSHSLTHTNQPSMDSHSHSHPNFFVFFSLIIITLLSISSSLADASKHSIPIITVVGVVYCDACHNNSFSTHSYFLPGAEVRIDCKFKAASPRTAEQITFSVNRTTNRNGVYKLDIPSVDGINCAKEAAVVNTCRASLIKSTSAACNVPAVTFTSNEFSVKSREANLCIYTMYALSFRPSKKDLAICGK